jgi:alginate O-acetyltransferase complex protein AlgI
VALHPVTLQIILPVGISFYTFQTLSYTIDVYRGRIEPTRDWIAFFAYVSFFPQLVAGPIERAANLLPQFERKRTFDYARAADGMRQILWGFFKKVVIADNCGMVVDSVFNNYEAYPPSALAIAAVLFAFQIYGDFSGYSDIAIGTARLFGFDLMRNFAYPYFSRDIAEFWRRWHISLSTWFRDYVYIPLGGSRRGKMMVVRNTFIIFLVSGFWHGANWTFIVWGLLHALYFLPLLLAKRNRRNLDTVAKGRLLPSIREAWAILLTFGLTTIAWVFFRAAHVGEAFGYLYEMATGNWLQSPGFRKDLLILAPLLVVLLVVEWLQREQQHGLVLNNQPGWWRWTIYAFVFGLIFAFGVTQQTSFIYFQF